MRYRCGAHRGQQNHRGRHYWPKFDGSPRLLTTNYTNFTDVVHEFRGQKLADEADIDEIGRVRL